MKQMISNLQRNDKAKQCTPKVMEMSGGANVLSIADCEYIHWNGYGFEVEQQKREFVGSQGNPGFPSSKTTVIAHERQLSRGLFQMKQNSRISESNLLNRMVFLQEQEASEQRMELEEESGRDPKQGVS